MANLLQVQRLAKNYGSRQVFADATFAVNEEEHIGVIGPNGAGKTTLFSIIMGNIEADSGQVTKSSSLRVGYLSQHDDFELETRAEDYVLEGATLESWDLRQIGATQLGLKDDIFDRTLGSLSGGYRMRMKLLKLLGKQPNLLLLDEPTNYLDLETVLVLENFLQAYEGSFLLISHDRAFLQRTTEHILEVEGGEVTKYPGNLEDYLEQKELLRGQLAKQAASQAQRRQEILNFVARFGAKATKAKQAQSRLRTLSKMETIDLKPLPASAKILIPPSTKPGKQVAKISNLSVGYQTPIVTGVSAVLTMGQKIAIVGRNGVGKSTLLKTLGGILKPLSGSAEIASDVEVGYYAQHVGQALDPSLTIEQELAKGADPHITPQAIKNMAGTLLFSGDDIQKPVKVLSGGEKARVALGKILLRRNSLLLLDEPTNHLDMGTIQALGQALRSFNGTVMVVSHDRAFLKLVADQMIEISQGKANLYPGTYDEYLWKIQQEDRDQGHQLAPKTPEKQPLVATNSGQQWQHKKDLEKLLRQKKRTLEAIDAQRGLAEKEVQKLTESMHGDQLTGASVIQLGQDLHRAQQNLSALEEQWLNLLEEIETLSK